MQFLKVAGVNEKNAVEGYCVNIDSEPIETKFMETIYPTAICLQQKGFIYQRISKGVEFVSQ